MDSQIRTGSDVCKIVTTAVHPRDNLSILRFIEERSAETRLVSFAMGRHGIPSRVLSPLFGAEFTFASLTETSKTADGLQLPFELVDDGSDARAPIAGLVAGLRAATNDLVAYINTIKQVSSGVSGVM